jgi:hypothetical protein
VWARVVGGACALRKDGHGDRHKLPISMGNAGA